MVGNLSETDAVIEVTIPVTNATVLLVDLVRHVLETFPFPFQITSRLNVTDVNLTTGKSL